MATNAFAARVSKQYGRGYHEVRISVNRLVNRAGWSRDRSERYVEEVLQARNDLDAAVDAVLREAV